MGIIAEDLIYNYSDKILPNLCKGVARSKVFLSCSLTLARFLGIIAEDFFVSLTCVDAPCVARGEPFARGFRLIDAGLKENPYFICHNAVGVSFMPFYNYSEQNPS